MLIESRRGGRRARRSFLMSPFLRMVVAALVISGGLLASPVSPQVALAADVPLTVTITKVRCTQSEECDAAGIEAAGQSWPDFYARIYINGQATDTPRAADDQEEVQPLDWVVTRNVPDNQPPAPLVPVTIQVWDHDSTSGDDNGDTSPVPNKNNLDIVVDLSTGRWSGDTSASCVTGDGVDSDDVEYYPLEVCFDISIQSASGDADGDGLLDSWERFGYDADGIGGIDLPLPAWGASPFRKDLFLELDFEAARPPTRAGIEAMRNAFRVAPVPNPDGSTGITLHVDTGRTLDPTADERGTPNTCLNGIDDNGNGLIDGNDPICQYLDASSEVPPGTCGNGADDDGIDGADMNDPDCRVGDDLGRGGALLDAAGNPVTVGACNLDDNPVFYATKSARFDANRRWVFRYAIQAAQAPPSATCQPLDPAGNPTPSGGEGEIGGNDFISHNIDAGTLMHELGHNLNLHHGGSVDDNCKPNYVSLMNYNLQFGIPRTAFGTILDYSPPRIAVNGSTRAVAPLVTLVEAALDENVILDSTDLQNQTVYSDGAGNLVTRNVNNNPNWDGDLVDPPRETGVVANIDLGSPACANTTTNSTLAGDHDWNRVSIPFRQFGDSADGAINPSQDVEPTDEELEKLREAIRRTDLVAAITSSPDPVAAGTDLTLNASITNVGPNPSNVSVLTITLPVETRLAGAVPPPCTTPAAGILRCDFGRLLAGESRSVTVTAAVPADLVYLNGGPLPVVSTAEVDDLVGDDADPASDLATVSTQAVAVADLSVASFSLPNLPLEMRVGEEVVVELSSTITSHGPSSPMDTTLTLTAAADAGARVSPTHLRTSQPALTESERRAVVDHLIIECRSPGRHRFDAIHRIDPTLTADSDPDGTNDELRTAFEVDCVGQESVVINVAPGNWPNEVPITGEFYVAVITTGAGEYGRVEPFDAAWIVPESVRVGSRRMLDSLEPGGIPTSVDPRDAAEPSLPETIFDGDIDLSVLLLTGPTGLRNSDTEACVMGTFIHPTTGQELPFSGCDAIVLVE